MKIPKNQTKPLPLWLASWFVLFTIITFQAPNKAYGTYRPPIGIPAPSFGIDQVAPPQPPQWPNSEVAGYYYVDNTHPSATDTANSYGYPNKPRLSIPTTLGAGSNVEIHGGPYSGGQLILTANGTAAQPVWIRGSSPTTKPTLRYSSGIVVKGSYVILENLFSDISGSGIGLRVHSGSNVHHAVVRNSEFSGPGTLAGNASALSTYGSAGNIFTDIVFYNNTIHGFGDLTTTTENDYHGAAPGSYVDKVWILNNHIYNMGGDSVQVGGATMPESAARPSHVYIGGNTFHDNRENSVDIKQADNVIVSQNIMHGAQGASSDPGPVVVAHNDPTNVWILNNEIYDGNEGITSTGSTGFYVIGNRLYDIHRAVVNTAGGTADTSTSASVYRSGIGIRYYGTKNANIYNNTVDNVLIGIGAQINLGEESTWGNNIVSNVNVADGGYHLIMNGNSTALQNSTLQNSILYQSGGSVVNSTSSFGQVQGLQQNLDPKLANPAIRDFHLLDDSPAISAGGSPDPISTFQNLYGLSIAFDPDNVPRPQGGAWDIGAYARLAPSSPTNLNVQ